MVSSSVSDLLLPFHHSETLEEFSLASIMKINKFNNLEEGLGIWLSGTHLLSIQGPEFSSQHRAGTHVDTDII